MPTHDTPTAVRTGFFPLVNAATIQMRQAGAAAVLARGPLSIEAGGANLILSGAETSIRYGGAQSLFSAGDVSVEYGGAMVAAARSVRADRSWVGLALGGRVDLTESRVLIGPLPALALGLGLGLALTASRRCRGRAAQS